MNTFPSVFVASKRDRKKEVGWNSLPTGTRRLTFHVDTGATFGPDKIPLVHGSLESPAEVVATITFETDEDCPGEFVNVTFYATAYVGVNDLVTRPAATKGTYEKDTGFITEQVLQKNKWILPVIHTEGKPNIIRKGVYTNHIRLPLDPALPSSCLPTKHVKASIQYSFHAQVSHTDPHSRRTVATVAANQNIWVLNNHSSQTETDVLPLQATEFAFKSSLPVYVSAPTQAILGQSLPVTLAVGAFAQGSEHAAQPPIVLSAQFKLLETRHAQPTGNASLRHVQEVVNMQLLTDSAPSPPSPRGGEGGWSRTIHVAVPSSPELTPSFECALVSVEYSAAVLVRVRAENQKDHQAEEVKLTLPIKMVAPSLRAEQLPEYSRDFEDTAVVFKEEETELGLPAYST
ncbi:hypothetical protein BGZ93_002933 [Podila epicladia]|nr:hypothetical protein BGZ93_002933 [Podila epicladia]KAG0083382.1 hypothetical protein BGZ92_010817 [Podila epicladia]